MQLMVPQLLHGSKIMTALDFLLEHHNGGKIMQSEVINDVLYEYDVKGNPIHFKDLKNGYESWYEYDDAGHEIHYCNNEGLEAWYTYDAQGNNIHFKNNEGLEAWYTYDAQGDLISSKQSDNCSTSDKYIKLLKENCYSDDVESNHVKADEYIVEFLREAEFNELADVFDNIKKWYA